MLRTAGDFGALVRQRRRKQGLNQIELARRAGVRRQWLVALEKGNPGASLGLVLRTMNALGIALRADGSGAAPKKSRRGPNPVDIDRLLDNLRKPKR